MPADEDGKMMFLVRQTRIGSWLNSLLKNEGGQSVTEYAVVMAVITLVALVSISAMGAQTLNVLRHVGTNLQ
jgi:Flp pilus assembly pilin Flp